MHRTHPLISRRGALIAIATLSLAGCGGGGSDGPETGLLSVAVTDTPIDEGITAVNVQFTGIEVKPENGPAIRFDFLPGEEKTIDLLKLQGGGHADLIVNEEVPAGRFPWMRLLVKAEKDVYDSTVEYEDGSVYPLYMPGGVEPALKLVSGFVVPAGGSADFIIDWNLAQAIGAPEGQDPNRYLRPALRITNMAESGAIRGTVPSGLIDENDPDNCAGGNRVYLFARPETGETAIDDMDIETDDGRAKVEASEPVRYNSDQDVWEWVFGYVAPGSYTVAFTCSSTADDSQTDDYPDVADSAFDFAARVDVEVEVSTDSTVNF